MGTGSDPTGGFPPFDLECGCSGYTDTINGVKKFVIKPCKISCEVLRATLELGTAGGKRIEYRSGGDT